MSKLEDATYAQEKDGPVALVTGAGEDLGPRL